ncbi:MAG: hypothetical protein ABIG95_01695 [Candidatus Woesearchaeota archaeon]
MASEPIGWEDIDWKTLDWDVAFPRIYGDLCKYAYHRLNNTPIVEDLVSGVLVSYLERRLLIEEGKAALIENHRAYLYRSVTHAVIDYFRASRTIVNIEAMKIGEPWVLEDRVISAVDAETILRDANGIVTPYQLLTFMLYVSFEPGETTEKGRGAAALAAKELGISEESVKSRVHRARQNFARILSAENYL